MLPSMRAVALVAAFAAAAGACGPTIRHARRHAMEPPTERELDAKQRLDNARCSPRWGLLMPGAGQYCFNKPGTGALLMGLTTGEIVTTGLAVRSIDVGPGESKIEHPAVATPLIALQDLWVYAYVDTALDQHLAARALFAPQDTLGELAWAPFNLEVLKQPDVWAGTLGMLALGVGVSLLVDEEAADNYGDDANLFGRDFSPAAGYPLAGLTFGGLFEHVAIAEESLFRGLAQSSFARSGGETRGWVVASLLFGAAHSFNAFTLEGSERTDYLKYGVPYITVVGSYLGLSYRWHDYSLAPPVAIHFWYDFLLTATFFAMDPQNSPISAHSAIPF